MPDFLLLGTIELRGPGRTAVDPGPPRQRTVLSALLVDAGRWVPAETLIDRVWGEEVPARVRASLYTYVSRIRRALATTAGPLPAGDGILADAPRLRRGRGGYLLDVAPGRVDVHLFQDLVDRARSTGGSDAGRVAPLTEAIGLWRGEPLAGVPGAWAERTRRSWEQRYIEAVLAWADAEARTGNATAVIGRLTGLVAEHPLVEPLTVALMRALHVSGRASESLTRYAALRERLAEELGTDPAAETQRVYQAILRGESVLPATATATATAAPVAVATGRAVPAQLPLEARGFTGRQRELAGLDAVLAPAAEGPAAVSALSGTAGVGKTALAVHWAHRVADRFPDGQLHVNLRGFGPSGTAVTPDEALRGFLEALGVPAQGVPADLQARVGLYRSLLAGRRVLVVLDNACDADQVRPLLPGSPGCFAVVTSRDRLTGLVAAEGAHLHVLDLLTRLEAQDLLVTRLGEDRVAAEPEAVEEIVTRCARLPLALAITTARAAAQPGFPLSAVAGELRASQGSLDAFDGGDLSTDARAVFSWSYQSLSAPSARLFRLLGLHTGPDISVPAAAALAGLEPRRAHGLLAELTRAHLLMEHAPGRYGLHDLLRVYATERLSAEEPAQEREHAVGRLLMWYLHTTDATCPHFTPGRQRFPLNPLPASCRPLDFGSCEQAVTWCESERSNLVAAVHHAAATGRTAIAWRLAASLWGFFYLRSYLHDWLDTAQCALSAARLSHDRAGEARSISDVACALAEMHRYEEAIEHFREAMAINRTLGDTHSLAEAMTNLGYAYRHHGRPDRSVEYCRRALAIYRVHGRDWGREGNLWANLGDSYERLDRFDDAVACLRRALPVLRTEGDRWGEGFALDVLGTVYRRLRQHDVAVENYHRAIRTHAEIGNRFGQAHTLGNLGTAYLENTEEGKARESWRQALDILGDLDHPEAAELRSKLNAITRPRPA
ncbi:BTAD domain-containing putative transcriptional regulator [Streptomyces sp. NBC_00838]|uniref:AfsR/SARP family transcriptional regulator n=1 Tax=Streptomyces sp. NBC_00838 TaxID=2903680 RepID=UPI0038667233|nr:BTAD domain-containing putative transcriptional regulator [Streptomyces sp. NBC_00838]